ncbi:tetratricopeptide repeat protein [Sphingomonas sp.]|uniref:tetratricopeptide repeat protein n=1 Tax=Sphingomonas sp. TaxID=28214 RepID=UPI0025DE59EF|nr:tetratricopeptide repeat protein [Sphingomonas sp.]
MKLVSTIALGMALTMGSAGLTAAVAKEKPAAAPTLQLSKEYRAAAGPAQEAVKANNFTEATTRLAALDAVSKSPDELFISAQLHYQVATAQKDAAAQAKAVDAMLASGGAPAAMMTQLTMASGQAAYQAGNYPRAIQLLTEAQRLGNKSPDVFLLLAEASFKTNQVPAGLAYVQQAVTAQEATGAKAPKEWYARAASVAYKAKLNGETVKWTRAQLKAYPSAENWRSALVIYRDSATRDGAVNLDVFRLMRATKSLAGERDYYEYSALATDRGLPGEAKSVAEEGFATSAVPAGSKAVTEIRAMANAKATSDRASLAASERTAASAANGKSALATGDAYLGYGQNDKAIALYKTALTKGGVDADAVNTHLGVALFRAGQKDAAKAAFTAVSANGSRGDIAGFWLLYLDQPAAA